MYQSFSFDRVIILFYSFLYSFLHVFFFILLFTANRHTKTVIQIQKMKLKQILILSSKLSDAKNLMWKSYSVTQYWVSVLPAFMFMFITHGLCLPWIVQRKCKWNLIILFLLSTSILFFLLDALLLTCSVYNNFCVGHIQTIILMLQLNVR